MALWAAIVAAPGELAASYRHLFEAQEEDPRAFYDACRVAFNATRRPELLLFLLARCAKAAVRYNARGEFNQAPDNRRRGARPGLVARRLHAAAALLRGRCTLQTGDYREALGAVAPGDVAYLDPPYQGVSGPRDRRYVAPLDLGGFLDALEAAAKAGVSFLLSFDGRTGGRAHGVALPAGLGLTRVELDAGRSSQATLLGRAERTVESLYLSPALLERLGGRREVAGHLAGAALTARLAS